MPIMAKKLVSLTLHLRNRTSYDCSFRCTCVKWLYPQQFFFFFSRLWFFGFSKFISKCQKEILRCSSLSSYVCVFCVFLVNDNPFSIKPTVVGVNISEKNMNFCCLKFLYLFQSGQNNGVEIWAFAVTRSISM